MRFYFIIFILWLVHRTNGLYPNEITHKHPKGYSRKSESRNSELRNIESRRSESRNPDLRRSESRRAELRNSKSRKLESMKNLRDARLMIHNQLKNLVTYEADDLYSSLSSTHWLPEFEDNSIDYENYMAEQPFFIKAKKKGYEYQPDIEDLNLMMQANEYHKRVLNEGKCKQPVQKCIKVTGRGRAYIPNCALIHHCGEDTGCCEAKNHVCSPIKEEQIRLYFTVVKMDNKGNINMGFEVLDYINHTECSCKIKEIPPPDIMDFSLKNKPQIRSASKMPALNKNIKCRCPKLFSLTFDGSKCICECDKDVPKCAKYVRGKRPLSSSDTSCIQSGHCTAPPCDYGAYDIQSGRCPRRKRSHPKTKRPRKRSALKKTQ